MLNVYTVASCMGVQHGGSHVSSCGLPLSYKHYIAGKLNVFFSYYLFFCFLSFSASEITYIVSGGALNSTHSLTATSSPNRLYL